MLKAGIVGLPNVGKSTLFNALLKKQVALAANYPFATIEPNVGVIEVPDERLENIAKVVRDSENLDELPPIVPAAIEFYDIAGLVAGASEGEGLGNKFLSHIRETALIVHVVRLFEDTDITHVDEKHDPINDINTIETELILSDLSILEKQKEPRGKSTKEDNFIWGTVEKVKKSLNDGKSIRDIDLSSNEENALKQFSLITQKKVLYVFNLSEDQLKDITTTEKKTKDILKKVHGSAESVSYIHLCAKLEFDLVVLDPKEQKEYLEQYNLSDTGLNRLITTAYKHLDLISFLTGGEKEVRAWTIKQGTKTPQAAGVIHTDFEKHFVKAEVVSYETFINTGGWTKARDVGKITLAGKEYELIDGDVVDFKVNV